MASNAANQDANESDVEMEDISRKRITDYFKIVPNTKPLENVFDSTIKPDPHLSKLKLNDKRLFLTIKEYMLSDPMDIILERNERKRTNRGKNMDNDSDDSLDSDDSSDDTSDEICSDDHGDENLQRRLRYDYNENTNQDNELMNLSIGEQLIRNQASTSYEQPKVDEPKPFEPICRRRRPAFRNEYFYFSRNVNIFNLIRYSFTSIYAQNFLKTFEGQKQVKDAIDNCRNMITLILPEEETAVASKILLISQQNIKQAKRANHKFRNSRWHRQLNQGVRMESFLYQTNFRFLKKDFEKWFIEEENKEEPDIEAIIRHDHGYYNPYKVGYSNILFAIDDIDKEINIPVRVDLTQEENLSNYSNKNEKDIFKRLTPIDTNVIANLETEIIYDWTETPQRINITEPPLISFDTDSDDEDDDDDEEDIPMPFRKFNLDQFRQWERSQKKNQTSFNYFSTANEHNLLHKIMAKTGKKIDLNILDDHQKLKQLWITLRSSPSFRNDPSLRDLYKMVDARVKSRSQWMRLESSSKRPLATVDSLIETLPYNPFDFSSMPRKRAKCK